MNSIDIVIGVHSQETEVFQPRKRFKTSELPLSATQRSTIDGLLHTIKKKGEYDTLRKKVWSQFVDSVSKNFLIEQFCLPDRIYADTTHKDAKNNFTNRLNELADAEIDRDPSFLSRDRGKAATLMQGAVDRSDIYKSVEQSLDLLVSEHLDHVLAAGREIRKAEIGEEAAAEEERRGNITDEEYAKEATSRREAREQQRKLDDARKQKQEEKERFQATIREKQAEIERLKRLNEKKMEQELRMQRQKEEHRKREEEDKERRRHYEQRRTEESESKITSQRIIEPSRSRHRSAERSEQAEDIPSPTAQNIKDEDAATVTTAVPLIDEKALEQEALDQLLREGAESAAKSGSKSHVDRSDSLEPPYRKSQTLKPKSSNISPSKVADLHLPVRSESIKPVLSFSSINSRPSEPPGLQNLRNKSPPTAPKGHSQIQYRSHSQYLTHRDEYRPAAHVYDDRPSNKPTSTSRQDLEFEFSTRDVREASHRSQSFAREESKEKEMTKSYHREDTYDRSDRSKTHHRDYGEHASRSSRYDRSRSREHQDRDRERYRDRGYDRRDRDRHTGRSWSPYKTSDTRHYRDEEKSAEDGHIDRYEHRGEPHKKDEESGKYRHRDEEKDLGDGRRELLEDRSKERHRRDDERHNDRVREHSGRDDERYRERDRERRREDKEDARYHEKHDDRDRDRRRAPDDKEDDRYRDRDRDRERDRRERDRATKDDRRDRDRDRDRDHDRRHDGRGRDNYNDIRDDGRDHRERNRDRRDDGRDRDRGSGGTRGYVSIDRYMPSGGRDDSRRARERDRDR
ncbi:MAG: hypothetical protein Q9166_000599 [cf. Caloplaca sp. 2 TL-2023]